MDRAVLQDPRLADAVAFALGVHDTTRLAHGLAVAGIVLDAGGDEELACAAILHDALEQAVDDSMLRDIDARFGVRVARVVAVCSENGAHPIPAFHGLDESRVAEIFCANRDTQIVAAADALDAVRAEVAEVRAGAIDEELWNPATVASTMWFFDEVCRVIADRLRGVPLAAELRAAVAELGEALQVVTARGRLSVPPLSAAS